jgi:hypothetical protein
MCPAGHNSDVLGPFIRRTVQGKVHENLAAGIPTGKEGRRKKLGCGGCDGESTGEDAAMGGFTRHGDIAAMGSRHRTGKT